MTIHNPNGSTPKFRPPTIPVRPQTATIPKEATDEGMTNARKLTDRTTCVNHLILRLCKVLAQNKPIINEKKQESRACQLALFRINMMALTSKSSKVFPLLIVPNLNKIEQLNSIRIRQKNCPKKRSKKKCLYSVLV